MIHNYVVGSHSHEERRGGAAAGDAERRRKEGRKEGGLDLYETVNEVASAVEMEMHLLIATLDGEEIRDIRVIGGTTSVQSHKQI